MGNIVRGSDWLLGSRIGSDEIRPTRPDQIVQSDLRLDNGIVLQIQSSH